MVGARRAEFDRQPHARTRAELVGVDPRAEPGGDAGPQHRRGLVGVERAALAEHVDPAGVRRAAASISPHTSAVYASASAPAGTTCAPRNVVSAENSRATRSDRSSSATVSPYPDLISIVVVPCRSASAVSRRDVGAQRRRRSAARVAATVVRMPPPVYGAPAIRAANSAARSPANTRCAWESTKPGNTAAPPTSSALSAAGARADGPTQATRSPSETTAPRRAACRARGRWWSAPRSRSSTNRASRRCTATDRRGQLAAAASGQPGGPTVAHHHAAVDHHVPHVGRRRREHRLLRPAAGRAHGVQRDRHQVGPRADRDDARRPASPAPHARPRPTAAHQLGRGEQAAPPGAQPLVQFHPARLLEQVDHGVRVRADAQRAAGVGQRPPGPRPSARSRSVVGHRHTVVSRSPSSARSLSVRWIGVDRRGARAEHAGVGEHLGRRPSIVDERRPGSRPAARTGGRAAARPVAAQSAPSASPAAGTARTLWIAAPTRAPGGGFKAPTRAAHAVDRAVAEPHLRPGQRLAPSTVDVR